MKNTSEYAKTAATTLRHQSIEALTPVRTAAIIQTRAIDPALEAQRAAHDLEVEELVGVLSLSAAILRADADAYSDRGDMPSADVSRGMASTIDDLLERHK